MPKRKFISRDELKEGQSGQVLRKAYIVDKASDDDTDNDRVLRFVISTDTVDRDGDTVDVAGWSVDNFLKNPVVLFAHSHRDLPVAKASNLSFESGKFKSDAEFMTKEMNPFSDLILQMFKGGFLNAVSVGFEANEFLFNEQRGGIDFKAQELLEYSVVPVPSNPEALQIARSKGLDTGLLKSWAEEMLDLKSTKFWVPSNVLEEIRKHADEKGAVHIFIQQKDSNTGMLFDIDGNVISKNVNVPKTLSKDEQEVLAKQAAYVDKDKSESEDDYYLLHHGLDGEANLRDVKYCMKSLLGSDASIVGSFPVEGYKDAYDHLAAHYKENDLVAPDFKFVEAQVLKNLPEDYNFDDETGNVKAHVITPEIKDTPDEFTKEDIAEMTTTAVKELMKQQMGKLD